MGAIISHSVNPLLVLDVCLCPMDAIVAIKHCVTRTKHLMLLLDAGHELSCLNSLVAIESNRSAVLAIELPTIGIEKAGEADHRMTWFVAAANYGTVRAYLSKPLRIGQQSIPSSKLLGLGSRPASRTWFLLYRIASASMLHGIP